MTAGEKKVLRILLRQILVLRDGECCMRCRTTENLQMSHIYPKGKHRRMEMEPENIKFLCYRCHFHFWHKSPIEAWEWLGTVMPIDRLKRLKLRANMIDKSPFDYRLYKLFLEGEITRLKK